MLLLPEGEAMTLWCCVAGQHTLAFTQSKSEHVNESVWCNQTYKLLLIFQPQFRKCLDAVSILGNQSAIIFTHHSFVKCCWTILYTIMCFTKWWTSTLLCLWLTYPFKDFFIPNLDTSTCYQWTCLPVEFSKQMFLEHSTFFPVFCCPCPNLFELCCWHQIQYKHMFTK